MLEERALRKIDLKAALARLKSPNRLQNFDRFPARKLQAYLVPCSDPIIGKGNLT